MTRGASHCSDNGRVSRTPPNISLKLFGVRIGDGSIRKSASMGNLCRYASDGGCAISTDGYASDDPGRDPPSGGRERKRGVPWTEDEHKKFLIGLQNLGKGDWRGIARNYVVSRTPIQVASHAQKYFIRQSNLNKRKRRSSLFDIVPNVTDESQPMLVSCQEEDAEPDQSLPISPVVLGESASEESHSVETEASISNSEAAIPRTQSFPGAYPLFLSACYPHLCSFTWPSWPSYETVHLGEAPTIVKPIAVHSKFVKNVDEIIGISKLSLHECRDESTMLTQKLGRSDRQSAFQASPPVSGSSVNESINCINAP